MCFVVPLKMTVDNRELPQDTKFSVEQNEKKDLWWAAEATSQLVTHWFQHLEKW